VSRKDQGTRISSLSQRCVEDHFVPIPAGLGDLRENIRVWGELLLWWLAAISVWIHALQYGVTHQVVHSERPVGIDFENKRLSRQ
jgi:hypothetical protein